MNFEAAVRYLLSLGRELAASTQAAAAKFDLQNISILAENLGRPERSYPAVHIAGTNGKGSTAAFLESILRTAGYRTGLYTSPHLEKINERIKVGNQDISDGAFAETLTRIQQLIEQLLARGELRAHPTYFECVTAMAFDYFACRRVDVAIFETGLGGRLDATNILIPAVCVITPISFDHESFLGHSLREIAAEKAGIIKSGIPVVLAEQRSDAREMLVDRAQHLGSQVTETAAAYSAGDLRIEQGTVRARIFENASNWSVEIAPRLAGRFQLQNAVSAIAAARILAAQFPGITTEAIQRGIATASWPGRIEKLQSHPDVYLDGAHNPAAAAELAAFLSQNLAGRKIWLLYGALRDKAVDEIAGRLFPLAAEVIFTEARTSRAISSSQLAEIAGHHAECFSVEPNAEEALTSVLARAAPDDVILVTGSLYLVGQLRHYWKQRAQVATR